MISKQDLIKSFSYFVLVVFGEVVLHFSSEEYLVANEYAMPATVLVYSIIAWMLKTNLKTLLVVVCLMLGYGVISFYSNFTVYVAEFPETFGEFGKTMLIKTLFYTLPLLLMVALKPRNR